MNVSERAEELRSRLVEAAYQYFVSDEPEMGDDEYDALLEELRALEAAHPEVRRDASPTETIAPTSPMYTIRHDPPMRSLDKAHTAEQVEAFVKRVGDVAFVAEPKIDGLAVSLTYISGVLVGAATRGDGTAGEGVTDNARRVVGVPARLTNPAPVKLVVRGEVYMMRSDLEAHNAQLVAEGRPPLATTRNAAAGALRRHGGSGPPLRFFAYDIARVVGAPEPASQSDALTLLRAYGLPTPELAEVVHGADGLLRYFDKVQAQRETLPYDIDGVVYKVNSHRTQRALGETSRAPRWAIAHKFPPRAKTTTVETIQVNVSRNGTLVPVAHLAPVVIDGVTVTRATLHNQDHIARLDIRAGDTVTIQRAGDVVPEITGVVLSRRPVDQNGHPLHPRYEPPRQCPACGSDVAHTPSSPTVRCTARSQCTPQIVQTLKHFASRRAMDIKGLGEKVAWELVKNADVKSPADLYGLRPHNLMLGRSTKAAAKLHAAIAASLHQADLSRVVFALGVPGVGLTAAQTLAAHFGTLGRLVQATEKQLQSVPGLGLATASKVSAFFADPHNAEMAKRLAEVFDNR